SWRDYTRYCGNLLPARACTPRAVDRRLLPARAGAVRARRGRRPVRVHAEAGVRGQGLRLDHAGARRAARSHRLRAARRARAVPLGRPRGGLAMMYLQWIVAAVVMISVLVVIHEFGHFLAAKLFGVGTRVFSFGMGPRVWGVRLFDTDFRLSAFPVGGYVQM